jgi:TPR repeat protein
LLELGRGVVRDEGAAYEYYRRAAAAGVGEAQAAAQRLERECEALAKVAETALGHAASLRAIS